MNSYYPNLGGPDTYVPAPVNSEPPSLEYTRANGGIVAISEDGKSAVVEVHKDYTVYFASVILNEDGTIERFSPRPVNRYVRVSSESK